MAINTTYFATPDGEPSLGEDEKIIRKYDRIQFELVAGDGYPGEGGNYYSTGRVYLTKFRVMLIPDRPTPSLTSIALPLTAISEIKENRPIFGDRSVQGLVEPVPNRGLIRQSRFRLTLKQNTPEFTLDLKNNCERAKESLRQGGEEGQTHHVVSTTGTLAPSQPVRTKTLDDSPQPDLSTLSLRTQSTSPPLQTPYFDQSPYSMNSDLPPIAFLPPQSMSYSTGGEVIYEGRPLSQPPPRSNIIIPGTPIILNGPIPIAYPITSSVSISSSLSNSNSITSRVSISSSSLSSIDSLSSSNLTSTQTNSSLSMNTISLIDQNSSSSSSYVPVITSSSEVTSSERKEGEEVVIDQIETVSTTNITNETDKKQRIKNPKRTNPETVVLG